VNGRTDRWIRWTTTSCVALLALIAGTVSYHARAGGTARSAGLGGGADTTVRGRDDRRGLDDICWLIRVRDSVAGCCPGRYW
jgi:hypothetical protein